MLPLTMLAVGSAAALRSWCNPYFPVE